MSNYNAPEGFSLDPGGSGFYYRYDTVKDPATGASTQWVTWFDPQTGQYSSPQQSDSDFFGNSPSAQPYAQQQPVAQSYSAQTGNYAQQYAARPKSAAAAACTVLGVMLALGGIVLFIMQLIQIGNVF